MMDLAPYSELVRGLLGRPHLPMALVCTRKPPAWATAELASVRPAEWFPGSRHPEAALAGLWLRFAEWGRAHAIARICLLPRALLACHHPRRTDGWNRVTVPPRPPHPVYEQLAAMPSIADATRGPLRGQDPGIRSPSSTTVIPRGQVGPPQAALPIQEANGASCSIGAREDEEVKRWIVGLALAVVAVMAFA